MQESDILPELDTAPIHEVQDACDVLSRLTLKEITLGSRLGLLIDTEDDLDSGPDQILSFAQPLSVQSNALAQARAMRESLLDHGAGKVRSPYTGKVGGVSIELIPGRGPSNNVWWTHTYRARLHHHTASAKISSTRLTPALGICKDGRSGLQGPLCNGYGGGDFVYRIITGGWANHPGLGGPRNYGTGTIPKDNGRPYLWGTEWDWPGVSRWPDEYMEWMFRCDAGLADYWGQPKEAQDEHKGWAPDRKIDRVVITRSQAIDGTRLYWDAKAEVETFSMADVAQIVSEIKETNGILGLIARGDPKPFKPGKGQTHPGNMNDMEETLRSIDETLKKLVQLLTPPTPTK